MTAAEALRAHPHRRFNPLTREWVLVSPHRALRPWQGRLDAPAVPPSVSYDPACYLCPGNARAGGKRNPKYTSTFVFDNDFPALYLDAPPADITDGGLLVARTERGVCRVVCFSPGHSLTLSRMPDEAIARVVDTWAAQFAELAAHPAIGAVQIFENRGDMMGASNPHPHGQIWATETVPVELAKEVDGQRAYLHARGHCLLCEYAALELERGERVVARNDSFVALAPFWAVWPFELLVLPLRHAAALDELPDPERAGLAALLGRITRGYDRLFQAPFPYTMGFHQRPVRGSAEPSFHMHAHFYPPLLRSAAVRKFMVGFEMLGNPQRDITPEAAAERLREALAES